MRVERKDLHLRKNGNGRKKKAEKKELQGPFLQKRGVGGKHTKVGTDPSSVRRCKRAENHIAALLHSK